MSKSPPNPRPGRAPAGATGRGALGAIRSVAGAPLASPRRRVRAIFVFALFVFSLFAAQLLRLQSGLQERTLVSQQAQDMLARKTVLPADRGRILDRNNIELAGSVKRYDLVISQKAIAEYSKYNPQTKKREKVGAAGAAADLAPLLSQTAAELLPKLTPATGAKPLLYLIIAKRIDPAVWRKIDALKIPGVSIEELSVRAYPAGASASSLLGWVSGGQQSGQAEGGGGGLEMDYNAVLQSTPGRMVREYSLDDRVIPMGVNEYRAPVPGRDVKLFLERDVQWFAYNAIADQVRKFDAEWGTAVVMDRQGRLVALAQYPTFDPNKARSKDDMQRNVALQDTFEPGSTAKVMSIGAALAEGAVTPTTVFTVPYSLSRADRTFHDSHGHGTERLTVAGILAQSSNTGTIQVGEKVSPETLERYYRAFGVGERSALGWTGETRGLVTPSSQWSGSQRYTVIFGQGLAVSAIQAAGVFQAIANDGVRIPATVVEGQMEADGTFSRRPEPQGVRVLSSETAATLRRMMESVVGEGGTAANAEIPGYRIAGKTGTSYIYRGGGQQGYTASFIGMAPAENPQLIVAVIIQDPKKGGYYGGVASAPVFRQVMSFALEKLGIRPSVEPADPFPLKEGQAPVKPKTATPSPRPSRSPSSTATTSGSSPSSDGRTGSTSAPSGTR